MTVTPNVHADDTTHRRALVVQLRDIRLEAGLRHADVAAHLGLTEAAVSKTERTLLPNPQIRILQRHARAVGHVAELVLHGIHIPATAELAMLEALTGSANPQRADAAARSLTIAQLAAARRHQGHARSTVAARMGISADTLYQIEAERQEALLSTYQRCARALGGSLTVELLPELAVMAVAA